MTERVEEELPLLKAAFGTVDVAEDHRWVKIPSHPLGRRWNRKSTPILVEVPPGYPTTPPDNFYAAADLRLADGRPPGNTSGVRMIEGEQWLQFSYHVESADWRPHADVLQSHTLVTYIGGVLERLREVS